MVGREYVEPERERCALCRRRLEVFWVEVCRGPVHVDRRGHIDWLQEVGQWNPNCTCISTVFVAVVGQWLVLVSSRAIECLLLVPMC